MPRQNDGTELFRRLTALDLYRIQTTTPGDTITTAAVATSATTVSISATTNFTTSDNVFIIGDGGFELNQLTGALALAQTVKYRTAFAQSTGARFVEAQQVPLGKIDEDGFSFNPSRDVTEIFSAQDDAAIALVDGPLSLNGGCGLLGFNPENLQLMLGFAETIGGAGTAGDPFYGVIGAVGQSNLSLFAFRVSYIRHDGKTGHFDLLNCRIVTSGTLQMARAAKAPYPVGVKFTQMVNRYN